MLKRKSWIPPFIIVVFLIVLFYSSAPERNPNTHIVFIVIDALRKDHLSCYGYQRNTTPNIDILAENGLHFKSCIAQSTWTLPSMASMFTSKYPSLIGVGLTENEKTGMRDLTQDMPSVLSEEELTLAEILKSNGYETISIYANYFCTDKFGLSQGFDEKFYLRHLGAKDIVDRAIEQIIEHAGNQKQKQGSEKKKKNARPFFMYLHFMDVHVPTNPPPPYDTLYPTLDGMPHTARHFEWRFREGELLDTLEFETYKSHKLALYDGALNFIDFQIGRLIKFIESFLLNEDILIVITSDHGEEFWDHASFEKKYYKLPHGDIGVDHGHTMFQELLDMPLIFWGKGVPKKFVNQQVRNIDIMPSLLSFVGIRSYAIGMQGVDLKDHIKRNDVKELTAFSEDVAYGYEKKSIQDDRYKFISGEIELFFDKLNDPLETVNIMNQRPQTADQYKKILNAIVDASRRRKRQSVQKDSQILEELRSLGYIKEKR